MAFHAHPRPSALRAFRLLPLAVAAMGLLTAPSATAKLTQHHSGRPGLDHRLGLARATAVKPRCNGREHMRGRHARPRWQCIQRARRSAFPSAPLYWGATIGDQLTGTQAPWDMNAVAQLEGLTGKSLSLVNFFAPFANCSSSPCSYYRFPAVPMESVRKHGSIPVFSWSSQSIPSNLNEPDFQLSDVVNGTYDAYIREFAEEAKNWGRPFFLRFDWEMNGDWFPWSEGVNGNGSGEYVAAWRHVHDIFTSVGATNANWVWCPNIDPTATLQSVDSLYPGDEYVDWTGLDGYNWGPKKGVPWTSFNRLFSSTYHRITDTVAPSKPMLIGEVGSSESGGSKAAWISTMLSEVPNVFPKIRGLLWFEDSEDGMDWPIESSASAAEAFAEGIKSPAYRGNDYATLAAGPIQSPS